MKTIGIKLADGTFYPILEEGEAKSRALDVTTVKDNQTKVQIDLYRSESGSMEDAEYVDTLEVTNLKPHPNGEPDLHLSVSIDENKELKAEVIDAETGKKSEVQVQLVSRTLAERESAGVDFSLPEAGAVAAGLAAAGAAAAIASQPEEDKTDEFITDDFSFDDFTDNEFASKEQEKAAENSAVAEKEIDASAADENVAATTSLDDITLDLPPLDDFNSFGIDTPADTAADTTVTESTDAADQTVADDSAENDAFAADDMFDMPAESPVDFATESAGTENFDTDATLTTDETITTEETPATDESFATEDITTTDDISDKSLDDISLDLPDFDDTEFDLSSLDDPAESPATETMDLPAEEKTESTETSDTTDMTEATALASATSFSDDDFSMDLPDFDDNSLNETDFSLPDFDETPADTASDSADETSSDTETTGISGLFGDPIFDNDDFTPKKTKSAAATTAAAGSAMDFSDLYDEETLAGEHSTPYDDEAEEVKRKTRVPVVICVVCAIICIIATLLVLFVIPSKYNLIKSRNTRHNGEELVKTQEEVTLDATPVEEVTVPKKEAEPIPVEEPEPEVPSVVETTDAQEDKIIVAPKPDIIPVPAEKPKVKKDVRYRIKWGDTLWDISDSYYKNPWKYPKIARYNGIKNPDLIISGTDILIPEE